jgi:hypothetical protein
VSDKLKIAKTADLRRFSEAEKLQVQVLELCRHVRAPEHSETLAAMNNLAITLNDEKQHFEAEKIYREALDAERRVLGPEHPDTLGTMNNLANTLQAEGHYAVPTIVLRLAAYGFFHSR